MGGYTIFQDHMYKISGNPELNEWLHKVSGYLYTISETLDLNKWLYKVLGPLISTRLKQHVLDFNKWFVQDFKTTSQQTGT